MRREKLGGEDMDREFARNVVRMGRHFKGAELRTGCAFAFCGSVGGWESMVLVCAVLFLSLTHTYSGHSCAAHEKKNTGTRRGWTRRRTSTRACSSGGRTG